MTRGTLIACLTSPKLVETSRAYESGVLVGQLAAEGFGDIGMSHPSAARPSDRRTRGAGFSYVEVLVAVVLVGLAVVAALVGLQSTVISSRIGTERSALLLWAREASEALHRAPYEACDAPDPSAAYQATVSAVPPPDELRGATLAVDTVRYLSIDSVTFTEQWDDTTCDTAFRTAGIRLTAASAEGTTIEHEVIVDG
jgi:Tfp pilus assembly protein PilV